MPAYFQSTIAEFLKQDLRVVQSQLTSRYANDGYFQLLGTQSQSWEISLPMIRDTLAQIQQQEPAESDWGVLIEYPLYRLRRRIDLLLVAGSMLFVVELKVGATEIEAADIRQTEEYALDLRDFHQASHGLLMSPILCCTDLKKSAPATYNPSAQIQEVSAVSIADLPEEILRQYRLAQDAPGQPAQIPPQQWDASPYEPVPTIIEAATTIFAGHSVRDISRASAHNLTTCSDEVLALVEDARATHRKRIIVVTGVPGAGKTLAGLNIVHDTRHSGSAKGSLIYLSGNTPLVVVIREALAQDEKQRAARQGKKRTLKDIRHELRSRIQHINDFLKEYYRHDTSRPPHEHAIVFDEAQRAWDHKHGKNKFGREASEPELLMDIMNRHPDWAAIVCLVGAGQEINTGEPGMAQWGEAVARRPEWEIVAPETAIRGGEGMAGTALFPDGVPGGVRITANDRIQLTVPMRSYRSERVSQWVDAVLEGRPADAYRIAQQLDSYPITLVRTLDECRQWLRAHTRGTRRCGLLASAGASRLRAEGLGVALTVSDTNDICHWYLKPPDDYRSSNALEVTSNEYTSQGLELDYTGICWGGDLVRSADGAEWQFRALRSKSWTNVRKADRQRFILNKYRVFLTRAREGMVLFVPQGAPLNGTRKPGTYDAVAGYLGECGIG